MIKQWRVVKKTGGVNTKETNLICRVQKFIVPDFFWVVRARNSRGKGKLGKGGGRGFARKTGGGRKRDP